MYKFTANTMTDKDAIALVRGILKEYLNHGEAFDEEHDRIFVVWKCKTIQNVKFIVGTTFTNILFEITLNGDDKEIYVDCYQKIGKKIIEIEEI